MSEDDKEKDDRELAERLAKELQEKELSVNAKELNEEAAEQACGCVNMTCPAHVKPPKSKDE